MTNSVQLSIFDLVEQKQEIELEPLGKFQISIIHRKNPIAGKVLMVSSTIQECREDLLKHWEILYRRWTKTHYIFIEKGRS